MRRVVVEDLYYGEEMDTDDKGRLQQVICYQAWSENRALDLQERKERDEDLQLVYLISLVWPGGNQ